MSLASQVALGFTAVATEVKKKVAATLTLTATAAAPVIRRNLNYTIQSTDADIMEIWNNSLMCGWINEWGGLRGSPPYNSFYDSLVRAIIPSGGLPYTGSNGNYVEVTDRNASGIIYHGRRWKDGRLMRNDYLPVETYWWVTGDADPTVGGTKALPAGAKWIFVMATADTLPSWAPVGSLTIRS